MLAPLWLRYSDANDAHHGIHGRHSPHQCLLPITSVRALVPMSSEFLRVSFNLSTTAHSKSSLQVTCSSSRQHWLRAEPCRVTSGLSRLLASDRSCWGSRNGAFESCRKYRKPRDVESHVGLPASASNGISVSQVCGSISSLWGVLPPNQCS